MQIHDKKGNCKYTFTDINNYMKNGILLRQVINIIDEIKFTNPNERHEFNEIYETMLKELQSAGNAGEFILLDQLLTLW